MVCWMNDLNFLLVWFKTTACGGVSRLRNLLSKVVGLMSPDIENEFYATFPELFRGRFKPIEESLICCGFGCGDERRRALWNHCLDLEKVALEANLSRDDDRWPEISQVKEKCGTLRVYVRNETDKMRVLREQLLMDSANGDASLL